MTRSEFRCLAILNSPEKQNLNAIEFYKACIALANNGLSHPDEIHLGPLARRLLELRRIIKKRDYDQAKLLLPSSSESSDAEPLFQGDIYLLNAMIEHNRGDMKLAAKFYDQAALCYSEANDRHRQLLALINAQICQADINCFNAGGLAMFEQAARREGFHDLVANIHRGRAHELMTLGRFSEALPEIAAAIQSYDLDGNPEDRAVSIGMDAILKYLLGKRTEAAQSIQGIRIRDGRVKTYVDAYKSLVAGYTPQIPSGHPLEAIPWKGSGIKAESVQGKILRILLNGPATRDDLIAAVWGPNALHPSYCSRLYVAINKLKKSGKAFITFDGEKYVAA